MAVPAWVSELGIAAQLSVLIFEVFSDKIRCRLSRPRLHIALAEVSGEREPHQVRGLIETVTYRRLQIRNSTRYSVASEVQVFITRIDRREPTGQIETEFLGMAPLGWQHQASDVKTRNIGSSTLATADLLFIAADSIHLTPIEPAPVGLLDAIHGDKHFWITVVARALNAESKPARLEVRWEASPQKLTISVRDTHKE